MASTRDPFQTVIRLAMFVVFYIASAQLAGWILGGLDNPLLVGTTIMALTGFTANALCLRIFEGRRLADCGLWMNHAGGRNLLLGLAGGVATAALVLLPPLLVGAARFTRMHDDAVSASSVVFLVFMLAAGSVGEELIFRGYGLQTMIAAIGPWATILPLGVLFGALHYGNPGATLLSSAITAGFGVLFGYAYLRSRDLWLPIGLHFGWNFTLPLFGVNMSGLRIRVTGWELSWSAGRLWSGGTYGPEASVLTLGALVLLWLYILRIPVCRQVSPLIDPPEGAVCEPSQPLPS